jgi:nickel-dependent lactate racemase
MVAVDDPFDVALTTNSGYPLDINLYQSVKGISAAAQVVRQGGAILIASQCSNGYPDHGNYRTLLLEAGTPQVLWDRVTSPGFRALAQCGYPHLCRWVD